MTLHLRSTFPAFPSPPPRRGWQRSEHCSQSFAPQITPQHVWVGTPGHHRARSGSWSPSSILLHRPYEVSQEYDCAPPGHRVLNGGDEGTYPQGNAPCPYPTTSLRLSARLTASVRWSATAPRTIVDVGSSRFPNVQTSLIKGGRCETNSSEAGADLGTWHRGRGPRTAKRGWPAGVRPAGYGPCPGR